MYVLVSGDFCEGLWDTLFSSDMRRANGRPQPSRSHRLEFHRDQTPSEPSASLRQLNEK